MIGRSATTFPQTASVCRINRITRSLMIALVALCTICSCTHQGDQPQAGSGVAPVSRTVEKGPVSLTISSDRDAAGVGENITLTLNVLAESGVLVQMPRLESQLGPFEIVQSHTPPDLPDSGRRRWIHRYTLRCFEAGEQRIPELAITFTDQRSGLPDSFIEGELLTPTLTLAIESLLAGAFDPEQYRDIKQPVEVSLPIDLTLWLLVGGGLLALAGLIWFALVRWRRVQQPVAAPPLPPHVWALRQLEALAADQLIGRGELHVYFVRLSSIVREYIERRFGIMAAEQTTQEFLREARRHHALNEQHRALLADFLRQADMVKFAKFQPPRHESEQALAAARLFVNETAPAAGSGQDVEIAPSPASRPAAEVAS